MQHPERLRFIDRTTYSLDPDCLDIENDEEQRKRLFERLPKLLFDGSNTFKTDKEKLLFLYLSIAALSGLLTNVTGQYRQRTERPNLYAVGVGRAGTGKGLIIFVQLLFQRFKLTT